MACQQAGKNYEGTGRQNRQYNNNNDPKSVNNVIDFLKKANVTITIQINDMGADQNYGNEVKSLLADLVQMCKDIQTMVDY